MSRSDHNSRSMPTRLADRYTIESEIGAGATSITWRGWDERLERPVAIKVLRDAYTSDETYVQRFRQEARAAASVSNGNVVDVYDFGQQDGYLFIVMQLVDGEDLKHLIEREAPLDRDRVRRIASHVLDGLQAIHNAGIVHRDVKPQNVLIGRDGIARLTDFGVAHRNEDAGLTTIGTTVGTAAYMAPEQAQGHEVTQASDLYAVGVMLYEMVTGVLPFTGSTPMATMLEHIRTEAQPPSLREPSLDIPPDLDAVILQAMAKEPDRRFRTARAMKQALLTALRSEAPRRAAYTASSQPTVETTIVPAASQSTRRIRATDVPTRTDDDGAARRAAYMPREEVPVYDAGRERRGLGNALKALLGLGIVALFALGLWIAWESGAFDSNDDPTPSPTATVPAAAPTLEPTATTPPTSVPTNTPEPTPEPTDTPVSTNTPEPTETPVPTDTPDLTVVPTEEPAHDYPTPEPTATEAGNTGDGIPPIIEPIDITPPS